MTSSHQLFQFESFLFLGRLRTVRDGLDFGCRANGLRGGQTALGIDQVGCEDSVDKGGFSETSLT
jgi:hypothetical protein